jgi:hypothetical protein
MAWSGGILLLLTNKCLQRSLTDYALGVAHNTWRITATIANFSPARSNSTLACVQEGAQTGSFFQRTLGFIRAVAGRKLLLDENCTSSSFMQFPFLCSLTTPVS